MVGTSLFHFGTAAISLRGRACALLVCSPLRDCLRRREPLSSTSELQGLLSDHDEPVSPLRSEYLSPVTDSLSVPVAQGRPSFFIVELHGVLIGHSGQ